MSQKCLFQLTYRAEKYFKENESEYNWLRESYCPQLPKYSKLQDDDMSFRFSKDEYTFAAYADDLAKNVSDMEQIKFLGIAPDALFDIELDKKFEDVKDAIYSLSKIVSQQNKDAHVLESFVGKNPIILNINNDMLLSINEVEELEEASIYDLNDKLADGWRIITTVRAVHEEVGAEAYPSYIMGRFNPDLPGGVIPVKPTTRN